jgi:hypothetical protein
MFVGINVTNLTLPSRAVVRFYNKRGTAKQWIKEGKQAVMMTCPAWRDATGSDRTRCGFG